MKAANEYILSMAVRKNICPSKSVWEALPSIHVYFHCSDNIHPLSIVNSWACPSTSFPKGFFSSFLRTLFLFINWNSRQLGRSHTESTDTHHKTKRNLMLAPANNQDLTPLNVVSSVTFTNFAFAVGLYTTSWKYCKWRIDTWLSSFKRRTKIYNN